MMVKIAMIPVTGTPVEIAEVLREHAVRMGPSGSGIRVGVYVSGMPGVPNMQSDMDSRELQELAGKIERSSATAGKVAEV